MPLHPHDRSVVGDQGAGDTRGELLIPGPQHLGVEVVCYWTGSARLACFFATRLLFLGWPIDIQLGDDTSDNLQFLISRGQRW